MTVNWPNSPSASVSAGQDHVAPGVAPAVERRRVLGEVVVLAARGQAALGRQQQHHAQPGDRHRVEDQRHRDRPVVQPRPPPPGGHHARGDADQDREQRRQRHQRDRVLEVAPQLVAHGPAALVGDAEVAVRELAEVGDVLAGDRLVEAELLPQVLLGGRAQPRVAAELGHGVARQHPEQEEVHADDDEQRDRRQRDPLERVVEPPHPVWCTSSRLALEDSLKNPCGVGCSPTHFLFHACSLSANTSGM